MNPLNRDVRILANEIYPCYLLLPRLEEYRACCKESPFLQQCRQMMFPTIPNTALQGVVVQLFRHPLLRTLPPAYDISYIEADAAEEQSEGLVALWVSTSDPKVCTRVFVKATSATQFVATINWLEGGAVIVVDGTQSLEEFARVLSDRALKILHE